MTKTFVCYLFVFSLLFFGVETAVDSAGGEHPHSGDYTHVADSNDASFMDPHEDDHSDDGHCSHCCHGHASGIISDIPAMACSTTSQQFTFYQPHFFNIALTPPTPPPNV